MTSDDSRTITLEDDEAECFTSLLPTSLGAENSLLEAKDPKFTEDMKRVINKHSPQDGKIKQLRDQYGNPFPLFDRDKDRIELLLLKERQRDIRTTAGEGGLYGGAFVGAPVVLIASAYYGVPFATLVGLAHVCAPIVVLGVVGFAAGHLLSSPGKRGAELKESIGVEVVDVLPFQNIFTPYKGRLSTMWSSVTTTVAPHCPFNACQPAGTVRSP